MRGNILLITQDIEEALNKYKEYTSSTGLYARIDILPPEKNAGSFRYRVVAYDEPCNLKLYCDATHTDLRALAKMYLKIVKLKVATQASLKFVQSDAIRVALQEAIKEKYYLRKAFEEIVQRHPIYDWCRRVKAGKGTLGPVDALMLLGFIDPHECNTGGRAKKFWGLTPEGKKVSGIKTVGKPELKGVAYMIVKRIIMGMDSYYYPLYQAKKQYLLSRYPEKIAVNVGNKIVEYDRGKKGYEAVINGKAMFWLMQLVVSNAQQIIREAERLSVPRHHPHIDPKPSESAVPSDEILEAVKSGKHIYNNKG